MTARPESGTGTREAPWSFAAPWGARGWVTDLDGPVHWIEFDRPGGTPPSGGAAGDAPPIVFVHGLGGSHLNWMPVGPTLATDRRAVALDLRGFGLTEGTRRTSTVSANVRLLDRFVREVVGTPVVLVGNSMGGLISLVQSRVHADTVAGVVLLDPALPQLGQRPDLRVVAQFLAYAMPGVGEMYMRAARTKLSPRQYVQQVLELCFVDPTLARADLVEALVALAEERRRLGSTEAAFLSAARSMIRVMSNPRRFGAEIRGIQVPVLLINGEGDRLVSIASARAAAAANPRWESRFLPGVGHTPQLEAPDLVLDAVTGWLDRHPTLRPTRGIAS